MDPSFLEKGFTHLTKVCPRTSSDIVKLTKQFKTVMDTLFKIAFGHSCTPKRCSRLDLLSLFPLWPALVQRAEVQRRLVPIPCERILDVICSMSYVLFTCCMLIIGSRCVISYHNQLRDCLDIHMHPYYLGLAILHLVLDLDPRL